MTRELIAVPFLSPSANAAFLEQLAHGREKIAFAVGAHTHHYDFRIVSGVPNGVSDLEGVTTLSDGTVVIVSYSGAILEN